MRKCFWGNPYQTTLETCILEVHGPRVLCDSTIVFSFSGGQESDAGTLQDYPILGSEIEGPLIYYTLPEGHTLKPGDHVNMQIDWKRRHALMRLHFAAELILEIVTQYFNFEKIGAHISEHKARIDFVASSNVSAYFDVILSKYQEIIEQDLPIETGYDDEATQRRYWKIEGFAKVPCGGTHVKSTGEVGLVHLKRVNIGGGKERIEIRLV